MFYVVIIQNENTSAIFNYSSYEEALAAYHTELAYRGDGRTSTKCLVLDNNLRTLKVEVYTASIQSVEEPQEG